MILTDREIRLSLENGLIEIQPRPREEAFASTTVDLTLGPILRLFKSQNPNLKVAIDPGRPGYSTSSVLDDLTYSHTIDGGGYDLEPHFLVLGWTVEKVGLNRHGRVAARVEGKSGLARIGLAIHVTAPIIHAGFEGVIQLEIINLGPIPIKLRSGISICQLVFEQTLGMPDSAYAGQFLGQQAR